jgi:3-hydroxyisobutyrate dehydrogenase-like beta-hydroxyacid dehydrogenase
MQLTVGVVGLGAMGSALTHNLLRAGYPVVGYDVDGRRLRDHAVAGGQTASGPAEVGERCDVVVTSLPSAGALAEVVDDLTSGTGHGYVTVETSTLPLADKLAAQRRLASRDLTLLDCPLSGTSAQARGRDLVVYVSGDDPAAKQRVEPVLDAFARARYDVGAFGNGSKLKYVANLLVAVHNVAAAEALLLAERAGIDVGLALRVLADGAGGSRMLQVRGPLMVENSYDEAMMRVELFDKDLRIIEAFAADVDSPTPLLSASSVLYRDAMALGRAAQDTACVLAVLRGSPPSHAQMRPGDEPPGE